MKFISECLLQRALMHMSTTAAEAAMVDMPFAISHLYPQREEPQEVQMRHPSW